MVNVQTEPVEHTDVQGTPIEPETQVDQVVIDVEPMQSLGFGLCGIDILLDFVVVKVGPSRSFSLTFIENFFSGEGRGEVGKPETFVDANERMCWPELLVLAWRS